MSRPARFEEERDRLRRAAGADLDLDPALARSGIAARSAPAGRCAAPKDQALRDTGPSGTGRTSDRDDVLVPGAIATDFGGGMVRGNSRIGAAVPASLSDGFGWATGTQIELSGGQNL